MQKVNSSQYDKLDARYVELRDKIRDLYERRQLALDARDLPLWKSLREECDKLETECDAVRRDRSQAHERLLNKELTRDLMFGMPDYENEVGEYLAGAK